MLVLVGGGGRCVLKQSSIFWVGSHFQKRRQKTKRRGTDCFTSLNRWGGEEEGGGRHLGGDGAIAGEL